MATTPPCAPSLDEMLGIKDGIDINDHYVTGMNE